MFIGYFTERPYQDPNWMRQLFSPSFVDYLAQVEPADFSFELAFGALLGSVEEDDPGPDGLAALCEATATVATAPAVSLIASFTWLPDTPIAEDPVLFTDTSTGGVTSRLWNFGDGSTSSQATPVKRYATAGTYNVTLTVYRNAESRVISRSLTIAARAPALPPAELYRSLIPVSAQSEGIGGSIWRTELTLFNAGTEGVNVDLLYVPQAGAAPQVRSVFVGPKESVIYANALANLFGLSVGSGAIAIEAAGATATPLLRITSRTFNDAPEGTYGLAVPDVASADLHQTAYLTGMMTTPEYRTNVGLVNRSASGISAAMTLYDGSGSVLATADIAIAASSFRQDALAALFPSIANRELSAMSMRIEASAPNALGAYASVVDNRTHDPLYIPAVAASNRPSAVVPIVGRGPGALGTFWRSDVTLFNSGNSGMQARLRYAGRSKTFYVGPRASVVVADVVSDLGLESGVGTLIVEGSGLVVTTRNYTPAPTGGTFGQSIDPVAAFGAETYVAGIRSDHAFRANLGFVNGGAQPIAVQAQLFTAQGAPAGTASLQLGANEVVQTSLNALFPGASGSFTLRATAAGGSLFAYGSIIDNASGDPVFLAGR